MKRYFTTPDLSFFIIVLMCCSCQLDHAALSEEISSLSDEYSSTSQVTNQCSIKPNNSCPTWFVPSYNGTCRCGRNHGIIECDEERHTAAVLNCYCVSYDPGLKEIVTGACFFNCEPHRKHQFVSGSFYMILPCNSRDLDNQTCRPFKRTGRLCGECLSGHRPLVYSYDMSCVECLEGNKNWWKFILAAFVPLTIFYFFILFFQVNAISSPLHALLFYSQTIGSTVQARIVLFALKEHYGSNHVFVIVAKILATVYGIWTLDFFRAFLPNICLDIGMLSTLALEYLVAVYPLILLLSTYFLIELYDCNFQPLVWIWKPFRKIFMVFKEKWNFRTSLIDAFATLFYLSFIKVLIVSADLLVPVQVFTAQSSKATSWALYNYGSIDYFGKEHLPYAILALLFLILFSITPVVTLLLYQSRCFQKLLNCCPLPWYILHIFADSFQGCFKNGTEPGTRDCRWFAGAYFVLRISLYLVYAFTQQTIYYSIGSIVLLFFVIFLVKVQPYKEDIAYHTKLNATFLVMVALLYVSITGYNFGTLVGPNFSNFFCAVIVLMAISPLIYLSYIALRWTLSHRIFTRVFIQPLRARMKGYETLPPENVNIPHRLLEPNLYNEHER